MVQRGISRKSPSGGGHRRGISWAGGGEIRPTEETKEAYHRESAQNIGQVEGPLTEGDEKPYTLVQEARYAFRPGAGLSATTVQRVPRRGRQSAVFP
jgi:hypothetical protein